MQDGPCLSPYRHLKGDGAKGGSSGHILNRRFVTLLELQNGLEGATQTCALCSASPVSLLVGCAWDDVTAACFTFLAVKVNPLWIEAGGKSRHLESIFFG